LGNGYYSHLIHSVDLKTGGTPPVLFRWGGLLYAHSVTTTSNIANYRKRGVLVPLCQIVGIVTVRCVVRSMGVCRETPIVKNIATDPSICPIAPIASQYIASPPLDGWGLRRVAVLQESIFNQALQALRLCMQDRMGSRRSSPASRTKAARRQISRIFGAN
jgi:hypothetical protein